MAKRLERQTVVRKAGYSVDTWAVQWDQMVYSLGLQTAEKSAVALEVLMAGHLEQKMGHLLAEQRAVLTVRLKKELSLVELKAVN